MLKIYRQDLSKLTSKARRQLSTARIVNCGVPQGRYAFSTVYVVVNFLPQLMFIFPLFQLY